MRIVIETDGNSTTAVTSQTPPAPSAAPTLNGGAAPTATQSAASSVRQLRPADNAGPAPKWLHNAMGPAVPNFTAGEKQASEGGAVR